MRGDPPPLCSHCSAALSPSSASSLISGVTVKLVGILLELVQVPIATPHAINTVQLLTKSSHLHLHCIPTQALMKTNLCAPIAFIRRKPFAPSVLKVAYLHLFNHFLYTHKVFFGVCLTFLVSMWYC